jgi:glycosyltransferase involved in cell wall biosynthesis
MNQTKGGKILVETLAELHSIGLNARLMFVGEPTGTTDPINTRYYAETSNLAHNLGVKKDIIQSGFVDPETASMLLQSCDMMVMPYLHGASLRNGSLIACLNNGCPIITTKSTTKNSLLLDGTNIIFVDHNNPLSTAKAITHLHENSPLRKQIGEEALKLQNVFNWCKIADKTANFFSEILTQT